MYLSIQSLSVLKLYSNLRLAKTDNACNYQVHEPKAFSPSFWCGKRESRQAKIGSLRLYQTTQGEKNEPMILHKSHENGLASVRI